jgi:hypothetical protein
MPRRRQRFSNLDEQLRNNGNVATPGTVLGNYAAFKAGTRKAERRKVISAAEKAQKRNRLGISLAPFNLDFVASQNNRYVASITQWSNSIRPTLTLGDAELGYAPQIVGGVSAKTDEAFYPALVKPSIPVAGAAPLTPKSGITGLEYNYVPSNSYGIPFGRIDAGSSEQERRMLLTDAIRGGAPTTRSVGYDPEVFRGGKTILADALAAPGGA